MEEANGHDTGANGTEQQTNGSKGTSINTSSLNGTQSASLDAASKDDGMASTDEDEEKTKPRKTKTGNNP